MVYDLKLKIFFIIVENREGIWTSCVESNIKLGGNYMNIQSINCNIKISMENNIINLLELDKISTNLSKHLDNDFFRVELDQDGEDDIFISQNEIEIDVSNLDNLIREKKYVDQLVKLVGKDNNTSKLVECEISIINDTGDSKYIDYFSENEENVDKGILFKGYKLFIMRNEKPIVAEISPVFSDAAKIFVKVNYIEEKFKNISMLITNIKDFLSKDFIKIICDYVEENVEEKV